MNTVNIVASILVTEITPGRVISRWSRALLMATNQTPHHPTVVLFHPTHTANINTMSKHGGREYRCGRVLFDHQNVLLLGWCTCEVAGGDSLKGDHVQSSSYSKSEWQLPHFFFHTARTNSLTAFRIHLIPVKCFAIKSAIIPFVRQEVTFFSA